MNVDAQYLANVLIVEDNRTDAAMLEAILHKIGCHTYIYADSSVEDVIEHPYDVVFLDIHLPDTNGFNIASDFRRKHPRAREVPIIIVSSEQYGDDIKDACLQYDLDGYVEKPIKEDMIEQLFDALLPDRKIEIVYKSEDSERRESGFFRKRRMSAS